jgi:diguanylate cyclase (GGDEF)-like protein
VTIPSAPPLSTKPALMLLDPSESRIDSLLSALEQSGLLVWRVTAVEDASHRLAVINPALVGLIDPGDGPEEALALLTQIKTASPYRRTLLFTDRTDAGFVTDCLVNRQIDHLVPLRGPSEEIRARLEAIVRTSALLHELLSANHQLSKSSKTDSLTGLFNHGHILEWLRIEHKRAARDMEPLCCVMIDLDYFKFLNDTYGHTFGDFVLRETAQLLRANLRESDLIGRYGGEEFLILAPKTCALGGKQLAEKMRRVLEEHAFQDQVFDVRITGSFGVATSDHSAASTPDMLLQLADKALFQAKDAGRNQVVVAMSESGGLGQTIRAEIDASASGRNAAPPSVLLVDDSPLMVEMLGSILQSVGLTVLEAHDGEQAITVARLHRPDCVLLDLGIPGVDGFETCRQIKAIFRDSHVPVILITSEKALASQLQGYESGADDHVTKPVVREHLIAKVHAQLRVKSLHDRLRAANAKLKQAQRTLMRAERLKAIGQMAAGLAHDFNNLLSSILGHAQVLQAKVDSPETLRGLQAIEQVAQEGASTIKRLTQFAHRPAQAEECVRIDVADVLEDCRQMTRIHWKDEAEIRNVRYQVEMKVEPGLTVRACHSDLREVFTNLIVNALEAMPRGGTLTLAASRHGQSEILVEVQDTGTGITPDLQRQIFDPFFTTKPDTGAGLGLSIAYGIVARLQGRIDVVSRVGSGSTFRVVLPADVGTPVAAPVPVVTEATCASTHDGVSVLIIDDEPHIREVFTEILTDEGYAVAAEVDGESGLAKFRQSPADVVLTDLGMPGLSGWEVARQVRRLRPETKIILTSGWGMDLETDSPEQGIVDAVLPKPVSLRSLLDCIESLVNVEAPQERAAKS